MDRPNEVIYTDWGYISYNSDVTSSPITQMLDLVLSNMKGRPLGDKRETAICVNGKFFILEGDWRDVLRGKSLEECMATFRANKNFHGISSDQEDDA